MFRVARGVIAAALLTHPGIVAAQPYTGSNPPHRGAFEFGGGVVQIGSYDAGSAEATLSTASAPLTLFAVRADVPSVLGAAVQAGIHLGGGLSVEATFNFTRPTLRSRQSSDFESATDLVAETTTSSYLFGGSLLYHFSDGRLVPFVSGGGGYLRQLSEGNAELLTGSEVHVGGGLKYWLGGRRVGVRVDAQASARDKLVAFERKRRILPALGAGLTFRY